MAPPNTLTSSVAAVTPLDGKTSVDDKMSFEPERLSYQSADAIARRIAELVRNRIQDQRVVIAETSLLMDFSNLQSFHICLDDIEKDYQAIAGDSQNAEERAPLVEGHESAFSLQSAVTAVTQPAVAAVDAALGLLSLFRADVEYHGVSTSVDSLAFELALAGHLKSAGAGTVFVPALMFISKPDTSQRSIRSRVSRLQTAKAAAWQVAGPLISQLVNLEAQLDAAVAKKDQPRIDQLSGEVSSLRRDLDPISSTISRADQRLSDLQAAWVKADSTGLTALARMLRAEAIQKMDVSYLHAAVVSTGGHNKVTRNLFRTLFLGDGLSFMGGVTARWALLERDGSVADGNILTHSETAVFPSLFEDIKLCLRKLFPWNRKPEPVAQSERSHNHRGHE